MHPVVYILKQGSDVFSHLIWISLNVYAVNTHFHTHDMGLLKSVHITPQLRYVTTLYKNAMLLHCMGSHEVKLILT